MNGPRFGECAFAAFLLCAAFAAGWETGVSLYVLAKFGVFSTFLLPVPLGTAEV